MNEDELKTFVFLKYGKPEYSIDWFKQLPEEFQTQIGTDYFWMYKSNNRKAIAEEILSWMLLSTYSLDEIVSLLMEYHKNE